MAFEVMKGFLNGFTTKGTGTSPETLPPDAKGDVNLGEELDEKGNTKKGKRGSVGGGTPMDDNLTDIAAAAEQDIESGYVPTMQEGKSKGKGFDMFNEMVSKGTLVDGLEIKSTDVAGSLSEINESVKKNFDIETKGIVRETVGDIGRGFRFMKDSFKEMSPREKKKVAIAAGLGGAAGATVSTGVGAASGASGAGEGNRLRGAKAGAKEMWTHPFTGGNPYGAGKRAAKKDED